MRTRVKICGITRPEDARHAALSGADAIGLVFYPPSPRNVDLDQANRIIAALPAFVTIVGLFVDAAETVIDDVIQHTSIDCLQFHGQERPEQCRRYQMPYIKAVRMQQDTEITVIADQFHDARGLLLDTYHPQLKGGSGLSFDWNIVPEKCSLPLILAGGLTPENTAEAISKVKPYAVDVSSGVEQSKGIKDPLKITRLMKVANQTPSESI